MRKTIIMALILIMGMGIAGNAQAQSLGGLLKKGKEAVEKGQVLLEQNGKAGAEKQKKEAAKGEKIKAVANLQADGIEVINPLASVIEVVPVGLYGVEKSENYGDAYLVLKVTMKEPFPSANFGNTNHNEKMLAVDPNGKVLNIDASGGMRYDTPEGIQVTITMDDPVMMIQNVKKDVTLMPMVKLGVFVDAHNRGQLTFKNVPVYWDQTPE